MTRRQSLGRDFGWLWAAFAASTVGTWLALDALPLIAVLVLHSSAMQVSVLSAAGLAVGALIVLPLGPWVEFRRKRPVMISMDLLRFLAMLSLPAAYALGCLGFAQLVVVSVIVAAANIVFTSASGAHLKDLVRPEDLLTAGSRFETTTWTATALGPPLGGAAIGMFGPLTTVVLDAVSYLLSALGIRAISGREPQPPARPARRFSTGDVVEGWRYVLRHPVLRPLFFNTALVNGLIMAIAPLLAVLLLRDLGFAPWQYGLAFGVPCIGGLVGSRLAPWLVARFGQHRVMLVSGALRACWPLGLAFVRPGLPGLLIVMVTEFCLITCVGVFNPVFATYRLEHTATERITRTLSAWSITSRATIATLTVLGGLLAHVTSPRTTIAIAGVLILSTPLLLPRRPALSVEAAEPVTVP
ncbi:MFS transporter [Streptomyces sp. NPDC051320]|uniref:MFS transporter n=1 Tax=Streptomyces sp. NPDC051320 TaxID=3154644 RepID=UPI003439DC6B